jgi:hypothetical protein
MADQAPVGGGKSLKELTALIAKQLARGAKPQTLINQLIARGWPEATARQFVSNARRAHLQRALEAFDTHNTAQGEPERQIREYRRRILRGLLCSLIGLALIVVGLGMHDTSNGLYHFSMGVVLTVFESLDLLNGLSAWWRHRRR